MSASGRVDLATGPVDEHLVRLTTPMVGALVATMGAGAAEAWFIGRLGSDELAAVSFTFPVVMVLTNLAIGLSAGTSSAISRVMGARDDAGMRRLTTDALLLSAAVFLVLSAVGVALLAPIFRLLGAGPELMHVILPYMGTWLSGFALFAVPMVGLAGVRATGDARTPSMIMTASALGTLLLDPLFIFGLAPIPGLGLLGAAVANLIVRLASFAVSIELLRRRRLLAERLIPTARELRRSWHAILHVGLPAAGTNVVIPLSSAVLTALVARHGTPSVAGYGLATRVEAVALVLFFALSGVMNPFVGQNLGARRFDRIGEAMRGTAIFSLAFGAVVAVLLGLFAPRIAALFSRDPTVVDVTTLYLRIVPASYGAAGIVMIVNACFNALARPLPAVVVSVLRVLVLCLPLAWLGNRMLGLEGIFSAIALSNLVLGALAFAWNRSIRQVLAVGS